MLSPATARAKTPAGQATDGSPPPEPRGRVIRYRRAAAAINMTTTDMHDGRYQTKSTRECEADTTQPAATAPPHAVTELEAPRRSDANSQ